MSATTPVSEPSRAHPTGRTRLRDDGRAVWAVVVGGALLIGLCALAFSIRIKGYILDETVIKQSAVHYTQGLPHNLFHDVVARATSRLYSLLISPLFAWFHGDVGVRAARGLNGPLFASAAIPGYLLARQALASRWLAAAAGLLSVALPWLTLTTAMFTENLAYPLVLWTVCAMAWAFRSPSLRRDLFVVVLIGLATGTRTQLFALAFGYLALVLWRLWLDRPRDRSERGSWARAALQGFPITAALVVLGMLGVLALLLRGSLDYRLRSVLGGYSLTTSDRTTWPVDTGAGVIVEVLAITLGVGVVPALLAFAWWPRAVAGRLGEGGRAVAVAVACAMVALFAFTIYAQGGFQGPITEERYYFYAAPFMWIGALAAVESRCVRRRDLLEAGVALALVAAVLPLPRVFDIESSYFAPAMTSTNFLVGKLRTAFDDLTGRTGLSEADALALILLAVTVSLWALWKRTPRAAAIGLGAAAVAQIVLLLTAFYAIDGKVHGVPGRVSGPSFSDLGFIDRATADQPVTWIDNGVRSDDGTADGIQRTAGVYNDQIRQRIDLPELGLVPDNFPLNAFPLGSLHPAANGTAIVVPPVPMRTPYAVAQTQSPFLQLEGAVIGSSRSVRLEVVRLAQPLRLRWLATGLDPKGFVAPGRSAQLRSWGARRLTLQFTAVTGPGTVQLTLGDRERTITVGAGTSTVVRLDVCGDARGRMRVSGAAVQLDPVVSSPRSCR